MINGISSPTETFKGTRPGDPYGDLIFNVVMAEVISEIEKDLKAEGLGAGSEWNGS